MLLHKRLRLFGSQQVACGTRRMTCEPLKRQCNPQSSKTAHPTAQKNTNATAHTLNRAAACAKRKMGNHSFL
ncbi:uncharacterized [Tachysurus ichikawai]